MIFLQITLCFHSVSWYGDIFHGSTPGNVAAKARDQWLARLWKYQLQTLMSWRKSINSRWIFLTSMGGCWDIRKRMQCVSLWCAILVCHRKTKQTKLLSQDCSTENDQNVLTCFGHSCMCPRWWVRRMFVCWTQWPKLPCSILSEFFAQQMAPCQQPWLADPRQDDSKILLIFWFLKFAPFTSNHWQYRRVSLFPFLSLQGALNWYCTTRASIHFFHWATELLRSALRIRSSTLGCLVFFWPWILLRWGRWWRLDRISSDPRHRRIKHSWLTKAYWTIALERDLTFKILSPQILEIANLYRRCRCIPLKCWINTGPGVQGRSHGGVAFNWSWWDSWTGLHLKFVPAPCDGEAIFSWLWGQIGLKWRQMDKNKSIKMNHSQILSDLMSPVLFSICFSNGHRSCASQNKGPSSAHFFHCCRRCAKALETKGRTRVPRKLVNSLPLHQS